MTVKTKKIILGVVVGLVALIAVLGVVAPTHMHVESSTTIDRPVGQVFAYLRSLKNGEEWTPWNKLDPDMALDYRGTDGQMGAVVAWSGNRDVGAGEQEITAIVPNERIDYALRFKEPMEGESTSSFLTRADDPRSTTVTWVMDSPMPFPMNIIGLLMNCEGMMKDIFAEGLASLKARLEQ